MALKTLLTKICNVHKAVIDVDVYTYIYILETLKKN